MFRKVFFPHCFINQFVPPTSWYYWFKIHSESLQLHKSCVTLFSGIKLCKWTGVTFHIDKRQYIRQLSQHVYPHLIGTEVNEFFSPLENVLFLDLVEVNLLSPLTFQAMWNWSNSFRNNVLSFSIHVHCFLYCVMKTKDRRGHENGKLLNYS